MLRDVLALEAIGLLMAIVWRDLAAFVYWQIIIGPWLLLLGAGVLIALLKGD